MKKCSSVILKHSQNISLFVWASRPARHSNIDIVMGLSVCLFDQWQTVGVFGKPVSKQSLFLQFDLVTQIEKTPSRAVYSLWPKCFMTLRIIIVHVVRYMYKPKGWACWLKKLQYIRNSYCNIEFLSYFSILKCKNIVTIYDRISILGDFNIHVCFDSKPLRGVFKPHWLIWLFSRRLALHIHRAILWIWFYLMVYLFWTLKLTTQVS